MYRTNKVIPYLNFDFILFYCRFIAQITTHNKHNQILHYEKISPTKSGHSPTVS